MLLVHYKFVQAKKLEAEAAICAVYDIYNNKQTLESSSSCWHWKCV